MNNKLTDKQQGHWVLAKMGKRVLRPGGRELTKTLITNLKIDANDDIVEFAPGLGVTAEIALSYRPKSYIGIELNKDAASQLREKITDNNHEIINADVLETGLNDEICHKVYGEAMLTMQSSLTKKKIIAEAHRILKPNGLYGIHELGLTPDEIADAEKSRIQRELAQVIKVSARPLTVSEWSVLLDEAGFNIVSVNTAPMHLLEKKRMLADEGFFRMLKIIFNILTHPEARKRIMAMRKVFRSNADNLNAVCIIAKKRSDKTLD